MRLIKKRSRLLPYISRIDYAKTGKGWWVRVGQKRGIQKTFLDKHYGSKKLSLAAAIKYRDKNLKIKRPPYIPIGYKTSPRKGKFKGYNFCRWVVKKEHRLRQAWFASWMENGKQKHKAFHIGHCRSFHQAEELAIQWRKDMIGRVKGC